MKKRAISTTALVLAIVMILSVFSAAFAADGDVPAAGTAAERDRYSYLTDRDADPDEISNAVVIPGVFQSRTRLYDENGNVAKDSEGNEYSAPFFLESTGDIVKLALKKCLAPLLITLFTQHDWGHSLAQNVADVLGWAIGEKAQNDAQGNLVYDVRADKYDDCVANLSQEDKDYIYSQIPLQDFSSIVDEEHLYFFSYVSLSNINSIVDELYQLIVKAAAASPTGKANIVPISQGGSLANDLLARYPQVGEILDRIIYIVPALDGTVLLGEVYELGLIDDDIALYKEMIPTLVSGSTGYLVNIVLRLLPNSVVNDILDRAVDTLIDDYIKYDTTLWALIPSANYPGAADKYLDDPEDAFIRSQTDAFYQAQLNSDANIMKMINDYGVEVFNIVDYNSRLYPIVDSWNKMNGDGVIHLDSTSMGSKSVAVDTQLPDDYVPVKGDKYVDKYRLVDAGAGLLPDSTFYFRNQNHEKTANNDVIMKLAICLLTDNGFMNIDSYPDRYPQFNEERNGRNNESLIDQLNELEGRDLSDEDRAELVAARDEFIAQVDNTVIDNKAFTEAKYRCEMIRDKILGVSHEKTLKDKLSDRADEGLENILHKASDRLFDALGGNGFSDIFRLF